MLVQRLQKTIQKDITDSCKNIISEAESKIENKIEQSTSNLNEASYVLKQNSHKNTFLNLVCSIIFVIVATVIYVYGQNYRDGTAIAEAKAIEALAEEREKFNNEMAETRAALDAELYAQRVEIENNAIADYKNSEQFIEDSCKNVAEHIRFLNYLNYLNIYIRRDDINDYPALKAFYRNFIKCGADEYKKKKRD